MKICSKCKEEKPVEEFYWKNKEKGLRLSNCKTCRSKMAAERWASGSEKTRNYAAKARRVLAAQDYLWSVLSNGKCEDCGETNPLVFEFDHIGTDKFRDISKMVSQNYGVEAIKREVAKCEIVCANCHKIRTSTRGRHWRYIRQLNN
jgi:hypothetical protein